MSRSKQDSCKRALIRQSGCPIVLVAAALLSSPTIAADVVKQVPGQFLGEWNSNLKDCGKHSDDSTLEIHPTSITLYESGGPLKAIVVNGKFEIAMIAELSGEGETWLTTLQFQLSADKKKLTATKVPGTEVVRYRCPTK